MATTRRAQTKCQPRSGWAGSSNENNIHRAANNSQLRNIKLAFSVGQIQEINNKNIYKMVLNSILA